MVLLVTLVVSPGKTDAVGEAAKQGKITPGAVGMDQFVKMSYRGVFLTYTKVLVCFIVSIFANVTFGKRNNTNRMPTTKYLRCLLLVYNQNSYIFEENVCIKKLSFGSNPPSSKDINAWMRYNLGVHRRGADAKK